MNDFQPAACVRNIAVSVFAEISQLAHKHSAVNLGQGFPDFDGPDTIKEVARQAIIDGKNQYAPLPGVYILREAVAEHAHRFYGQSVHPDDNVTITSGATEAIWSTITALIDKGDEVIVFEPCYDSYVPAIEVAGGRAVPVTLHYPDFQFNIEEVRDKVTAQTKVILINTPHNPTGSVLSIEDATALAELCQQYNLIAITDEVYEHLVYDAHIHTRLATISGMEDRTVTISSIGKSFSLTGWKVGWVIAPNNITKAISHIHQFVVFAVSTPLQHATAVALRLPDEYFSTLVSEYQRKRDFLYETLQKTLMQPIKPQGSYFIMTDFSSFDTVTDSIVFSKYLIEEIGVAAIPSQSFYLQSDEGQKLIRFCFCKRNTTLENARERIFQLQRNK